MGGGGRYERDDVDRILYPIVFLLFIRWDDFHPHPNVKAGHPEVFSISLYNIITLEVDQLYTVLSTKTIITNCLNSFIAKLLILLTIS